MQGYEVTQSSTAYPLVFLLIASSDHITGLTGASPTVTISKNGGAFASPAGAVTEIGDGWYKVAGNATDTNTLGPLCLHATAASADPTDMMFPVVAVNPQSTAYGLSLAKTTNITGFNDIAATAVVSGGAITTSGGAVSTVTTVGSVSGAVGSVTGDVGGNVVGSVGSISGVTFPSNFAAMSLDVSGRMLLQPTQTGVTIPTVTTVGTLTTNSDKTGYSLTQSFPSNFASLVINASGYPSIDLTQAVPTSNTAQTVGDALNAARAQGFGKWAIVGTTLSLYASDGTTVVKSFTLDSASAPTSRS